MEKIRIQKIIADSGYCSRRKAEQYIQNGEVKVNGRPVSIGDKADPRNDLITVNGEKIKAGGITLRYIKLYKPRGYVTTMSDDQGRKTVTDLLDGIEERVYPIGRLDRNSEGLLLLTNDGAFANDIMHPRKHVPKTYRVTVAEKVTEEQINKLMAGVEIEPNVMTKPCIVNILLEEDERTVLEFTIKEGKNRQIRKMCDAVNLTVKRLRRTSVGGVKLGMLKPGEYAELTKEEMRVLRNAMGQAERPTGGRKGGRR
ncbi:MAG: rRNA pseudouridine synthase [Ruminiclostridium sp.]|nr:rRNA pseudouridine synthase [Ruminiclostridium sp.]MBQ8841489.1 rRNA pseudouridine synthase [Ruminiclostridium sp.]